MVLLSVKELSLSFSNNKNAPLAVNGVSFDIAKGESLGLVGESGSGKSLTALSIMGLLPKQAIVVNGNIFFEEKELLSTSFNEIRRLRGDRISMIFQEPMTSLNPVMRCGKQVAESIVIHQNTSYSKAKKKAAELFELVKLPRPESILTSYPHQLSGGQKQRVMIAMALANNPDLLIADEPTTALDVTVQKEIIQLLNEMKKTFNMSLLFISHDLGVVAEIAEKVAIMYKGRIVEQGAIDKVFSKPEHPYTKGLIACKPPLDKKPERLQTLEEYMKNADPVHPASGEAEKDSQKTTAVHEMTGKKPLLSVENLEKKYVLEKSILGKPRSFVNAVNKVTLNVYPGETLGLVGESGCGKTTLGRCILRLVEPDSGKILFEEKNILNYRHSQMDKLRKKVNIVFQDPYSSLSPRMSIGKAIMEPMKVHGLYNNREERRRKTIELLEKVGLEAAHFYRYPHEFSGGQRQRIVIARALALSPRFIICDEAVSALDVSVQAKVLNLLNDLKKEFGFTYIFISHDLSVVKYMSDRIMVMKQGKIVEEGSADEIYKHPKSEYTRKLIESIPKGI